MTRAFLLVLVCLVASACASLESEPTPPQDPPSFNVGFLILPGVYNTELMAPYDMFDHVQYHATPQRHPELFHGSGAMRCFTVAKSRGMVTSYEGLIIGPHDTLHDCPPIDVLVVPSAAGNMDRDLHDHELLAWVRDVGTRATFVISLCDGAFLLAGAGLLDGREATTFPSDQSEFARCFANVRVQHGVSFVQDGKFLTSVGGRPSYEVALYLIEQLYGAEVARGVADGVVIEWDCARTLKRIVTPPNVAELRS